MLFSLAKTLVDKKYIHRRTLLLVSYNFFNMDQQENTFGEFIINNIFYHKDRIFFNISSTFDESRKVINSDQIIKIDGMEPTRFADIFNINSKGNNKTLGKRSGRKPKNINK